MEAKCQYCGRMYEIGKSELEELAASAQKREQRRNVIVCRKINKKFWKKC